MWHTFTLQGKRKTKIMCRKIEAFAARSCFTLYDNNNINLFSSRGAQKQFTLYTSK